MISLSLARTMTTLDRLSGMSWGEVFQSRKEIWGGASSSHGSWAGMDVPDLALWRDR